MATAAFENRKIQLSAKKVNGGDFPPSLKADFYNGNPQLSVLTGIRKGNGITFIRAGLEAKTAGVLCHAIELFADRILNSYKFGNSELLEKVKDSRITIECKSGKERDLSAKIVVGSDKTSGRLFISVIDAKKQEAPIIQFFFREDLYHPMSSSGDFLSDMEISALAAKDWATRTRELWTRALYDAPAPENPNNKGNKNSDSGSSSSSITDKDMPW